MTRSFVRGTNRLPEASRAYVQRLEGLVAGRRLVVWGAGRAGTIATRWLRDAGATVGLVVDSDSGRHGDCVDGVSVAGPGELRPGTDFVLLASMHAPQIQAALVAQGWQVGRDVMTFPLGSIYRPGFGCAVELLPPPPLSGDVDADSTSPVDGPPEVTVFASSGGNFYFRELQAFLVEGLRRAGWTAHVGDEESSGAAGVPLVVGPHEFFSVGRGVEWLSAENLSAAVLVTTEQPQSLWCQAIAPAVALAGAVVDVAPASVAAWAERGVDAQWLPLGWFRDCGVFDVLPPGLVAPAGWAVDLLEGPLLPLVEDRWDDRSLDVVFIGSRSPRRARALATLQRALPDVRWAVHMPDDVTPMVVGGSTQIPTAATVALARRAKVVLNLHRDDASYFEWQRIVWRGLWQRALVVTEPAGTVPGLVAGRDYVEVPVDQMAETLRAVLTTAKGRHEADVVRSDGCARARAITFEHTVAVLDAAVRRVGRSLAGRAATAGGPAR